MAIKYTVITPVYNGEQFIESCVEAVANVDYDLANIEHIVVDDGSKDRTKEICESLTKKYSHLKFYSKPNGNWGSVINYVKNNKLAHGDYIMVCDADDKVTKTAFAKVNKKVEKLKTIPDIFAGSFYIWNGKKRNIRIWSYYFLFRKMLTKKRSMQYFSPLLLPFSTYVKNDIFYSIKDLKEGISYQDNILYANAFANSKTIGLTKTSFVHYWKTRGGNTMSSIVSEKGIKNQMLNFEFFSQNNMIEPFFFVLVGFGKLKKYLKQNNIKYYFEKKKPDLSGFPWYVRPILKLMFICKVKKLVK